MRYSVCPIPSGAPSCKLAAFEPQTGLVFWFGFLVRATASIPVAVEVIVTRTRARYSLNNADILAWLLASLWVAVLAFGPAMVYWDRRRRPKATSSAAKPGIRSRQIAENAHRSVPGDVWEFNVPADATATSSNKANPTAATIIQKKSLIRPRDSA